MQKIKKFLSAKPGFTLIELLVVISIIGILASLTFVSYSGAQKQARDTERRSDLAQYRNGLANYATANNGMFTSRRARQSVTSYPCDKLNPNFISACPGDPGNYTYYYRSYGDGGGVPTATEYVLWVQLETGGFWEVCSNGKSGKLDFTLESQINDASGNCQLP